MALLASGGKLAYNGDDIFSTNTGVLVISGYLELWLTPVSRYAIPCISYRWDMCRYLVFNFYDIDTIGRPERTYEVETITITNSL